MRFAIPILAAVLSGCAATPVAQTPADNPRPIDRPQLDVAKVRADVVSSAVARYGQAEVDEALSADTYLLVKIYPGMAPPPPPDAGPDWKPYAPVAVLRRDAEGRWLTATDSVYRQTKPPRAAEIATIVADPALFREDPTGPQGCTDAPGTLYVLKVPGRPERVSRGLCGPAPLGEQLAFAAVGA